jgi:hypothetical protein
VEKNKVTKVTVYAQGGPDHATLAGKPITGDAANITAVYHLDGAAAVATTDVNPVELSAGYYQFDIAASENNGNHFLMIAVSSTANVQVIVGGGVNTTPNNFNTAIVDGNGRTESKLGAITHTGAVIPTVSVLTDHTPQTGDSFVEVSNVTYGLSVIKGYVDELESRLSAARAGYLDKLNITGDVAGSAEVTAIQNNTRIRLMVPKMLERPDSGSTLYKLWIYLYDEIGNMEAPDSLPTITAKNQADVDRSASLGVVSLESVGVYSVTYLVSSAHAIEQIIFEWSTVEGGVTRKHGDSTMIVDTTAVDFTSADRTKLDNLHDIRLTAGRAANLDNLDDTISTKASQVSVDGKPTLAQIEGSAIIAKEATQFNPATTPVELLLTGGVAGLNAEEFRDLFMNTVLLGSTYNVPNSLARKIRTLGDAVGGTVTDAGATVLQFDTDLTSTDPNHFNDQTIYFRSGNLAGQSNIIVSNSTTGLLTFDEEWTSPPDNGSDFEVLPTHVHSLLQVSRAVWADTLNGYTDGQAGKRLRGLSTIPVVEGLITGVNTATTFTTDLTGYDNDHFGDELVIVETGVGTDSWQTKPCLSYNGTTGEFVVDEAYTFVPVEGARVVLRAEHEHPLSQIASKIFSTVVSESYAADGAEMNLSQFMYMMLSLFAEPNYAGETLSTKKLDGVTTSMTFTVGLDGNGKAISLTRAS